MIDTLISLKTEFKLLNVSLINTMKYHEFQVFFALTERFDDTEGMDLQKLYNIMIEFHNYCHGVSPIHPIVKAMHEKNSDVIDFLFKNELIDLDNLDIIHACERGDIELVRFYFEKLNMKLSESDFKQCYLLAKREKQMGIKKYLDSIKATRTGPCVERPMAYSRIRKWLVE